MCTEHILRSVTSFRPQSVRVGGLYDLEVSHGLRDFYEPDFIVDTSDEVSHGLLRLSELNLEISHGLRRFYEPDLCRHVHLMDLESQSRAQMLL